MHTVHNERPEPACASMPSDPPELIVKLSSKVAPWKLSVTTDRGQKPGHFWKFLKIPPGHN